MPLKTINEQASREKALRHGHPSTLHLWWARRPFSVARAVLFASVVDDPSGHPELYPTVESQDKERKRLFSIIEKLVVWENSNDADVLNQAKEEMKKYSSNIEFLDPFSGGGAMPLEAARLGMRAHAHDLNPVAVLINKAMIEIPPAFKNLAPVNSQNERIVGISNSKYAGMSEDIRYYGIKVKEMTYSKVGNLYPKISISGEEKDVLTWIWARTIECPNPLCRCETYLVKSNRICNKPEKKKYVHFDTSDEKIHPYVSDIKPEYDGTVNRNGAFCLKCGNSISLKYIREEGKRKKIGSKLLCVVYENNGKDYANPLETHEQCAALGELTYDIDGKIAIDHRYMVIVDYGYSNFSNLFTSRQYLFIQSVVSSIREIRTTIECDALKHGMADDKIPLSQGGTGAYAYSQAISVYLSFLVDKLTNSNSSFNSWDASRETVRSVFSRQAIPMIWDYAEVNPFSNTSGCFDSMLEWIVKSVKELPDLDVPGMAEQRDASTVPTVKNCLVSTDPPYYDNITYSDLSDFFYIWLRAGLRDIYPELFQTVLVPKSEELVALPSRFEGGKKEAQRFFETGMSQVLNNIHEISSDEFPVTIYYAYKRTESESNSDSTKVSSTGWETMLNAIIDAGFSIVGTWPVRTEMANRTRAMDSNALASSIILVCRKRDSRAGEATRREFINELRAALKESLTALQKSNLAPVDMAQSSIGPGIKVYSQYSAVLDADGTRMTVRTALQLINQELDSFNSEQESNLDSESRFCLHLYSQCGFDEIKYGEAEILATAKNVVLSGMNKKGILSAEKGLVHLNRGDELYDRCKSNCAWVLCQKMAFILTEKGTEACSEILSSNPGPIGEAVKTLTYNLYSIAEKKNWTNDAQAFNSLISSWSDIQDQMNTSIKSSGLDYVETLDRWVKQ